MNPYRTFEQVEIKYPISDYLVGFRRLNSSIRQPGEPHYMAFIFCVMFVITYISLSAYYESCIPFIVGAIIQCCAGALQEHFRVKKWDEVGIHTVYVGVQQ